MSQPHKNICMKYQTKEKRNNQSYILHDKHTTIKLQKQKIANKH